MLHDDIIDYFDHAAGGVALGTPQRGVRSGAPFSSDWRAFHGVVASTVEKSGTLAQSPDMGIELVRTRTAQQYPPRILTQFLG